MNFPKELYRILRTPPAFALWAMAKSKDLNAPRRRRLLSDGTVRWEIGNETGACADHLELSGFHASSILSYGRTNLGTLRLMKHLIVPTMRTLPDVTQSSYSFNFCQSAVVLKCEGIPLRETVQTASIRGALRLVSTTNTGLIVTRIFYPAVDRPALLEEVTVRNDGTSLLHISAATSKEGGTMPAKQCKDGPFYARAGCTNESGVFSSEQADFSQNLALAAGKKAVFYGVYYALRQDQPLMFSIKEEMNKRKAFIQSMFRRFSVETPLQEVNSMFSHAVLRGSESIFQTPGGRMHAPGGGSYYAALWTNDQCEYANPFFPFSGYAPGLEQAANGYRLYGKLMDKSDTPMEEKAALPTSIICGGEDIWNGAGDRGDGSMYAYGLGRFLLEMSDEKLLGELYENLVWALDFALSRKNAHGVIDSDSDELENRFPSGSCNLFTSSITYDALFSGQKLAEHLGDTARAALWAQERAALKQAIEAYFGDRVEGFETYRYYSGNTALRAWICMPLTVGIDQRSEETVRALYSDQLYQNGMLRTISSHKTTWDRSLLFAMRGTFLSGHSETAMKVLKNYCHSRLLGSHAPYAFEAWPEGNRAQLAGESLLFARVITEGLLGLQAVGWNHLKITPRLTADCPWIKLNGLRLFGQECSIAADKDAIRIDCGGHTHITSENDAVFSFDSMRFIQK